LGLIGSYNIEEVGFIGRYNIEEVGFIALWVYMGVNRCVWVYMGVYGCIWVCMGVYGCIWVYMGVYGCIWVYMGISHTSHPVSPPIEVDMRMYHNYRHHYTTHTHIYCKRRLLL
jgi:hypothetical protein